MNDALTFSLWILLRIGESCKLLSSSLNQGYPTLSLKSMSFLQGWLIIRKFRGFPGHPGLHAFTAKGVVQSLVGELKFHKHYGRAKHNNSKTKNKI